jgi:hypothetical protein
MPRVLPVEEEAFMISIDKCSGPECPCHMNLKPIRTIRNAKIKSISIDYGPPVFPGAGAISIQMIDATPKRDLNLERIVAFEANRRRH